MDAYTMNGFNCMVFTGPRRLGDEAAAAGRADLGRLPQRVALLLSHAGRPRAGELRQLGRLVQVLVPVKREALSLHR